MSALDAVTVLAPDGGGALADFLAATAAGAGVGEPFDPERLATLEALSAALLAAPALRRDPGVTAVAFWLRRAQAARLAAEFQRRAAAEPGTLRAPVGRVFHVAPANVDTMFLYSWSLAFLCGNANVVRLPQERPPVVDAMLAAISGVADAHPVLREGSRLVTYPHDPAITVALSAWCGHRVIWGGDDSVAELRPLPLPPHASERVFGTKFSYAVMDAQAFLATGAEERARLAGAFYNDVFWFEQMACSSPHLVFWVGSEVDAEAATAAFEASLEAEVERRGHVTDAATASHRRAFAFELAADAEVRVTLDRPGFVGVRVHDPRGLAHVVCGGGLLRHYRVERPGEVAAHAVERDQTVTHFGLDERAVRELAHELGARGVDRVVPVGEALAFDAVWDGFDLLDDFTRRVRVKPT